MMRLLLIALAALLLAGCRPVKETTMLRNARDSLRAVTAVTDTARASRAMTDSIYVRDSIFMMVRGDTVTEFRDRVRYITRIRADTVHHTMNRTDTVYIEKTAEVQEKAVTRPDTHRIAGRTFMIAAAIAFFILLIWPKSGR